MEHWEKDFEFLQVRHYVARSMGLSKLPDLQSILFLIGIQELGRWSDEGFSKEEKQDLMHVAVCTLLEEEGYYRFEGRDHDGWPHFKKLMDFDIKGLEGQEDFLIRKVIEYFRPNIMSTPEIMN